MYSIITIIHMVCVHVGMFVSHFYFCSKIKFRHDLLLKMTSIKQCTFFAVKEQRKRIHQKSVVSSFGEYISLCFTFLVLRVSLLFHCGFTLKNCPSLFQH